MAGGCTQGRLSTARLNEVISRTLSICYRGSGDRCVAMARTTQKGVAWERVQGSGVRVRRSQVTASWTAHKRSPRCEKKEERKEGRRRCGGVLLFFFFYVGRLFNWTPLDINIELGW